MPDGDILMLENLDIAELHVILKDNSKIKNLGKGFFEFTVRLPGYAISGFYQYGHYINIYLYRDKETAPFISGYFCYTNIDQDDKNVCYVVVKSDIVEEHPIAECTKWYTMGKSTIKIGKQDYYNFGYLQARGKFCLHAEKIVALTKEIQVDLDSVFSYWYCAEAIDDIAKLYAENYELFFEAARVAGIKTVYVGKRMMSIREQTPGESFSGWLSSFSELLGRCHGWDDADSLVECGLQGGGGTNISLSFVNLAVVFPEAFLERVYDVWTEKPLPWYDDKELLVKDGYRSLSSQKFNSFSTKMCYYSAIAHRELPVPELTNANNQNEEQFNEYVLAKTIFLKKLGKYLYSNDYRLLDVTSRNGQVCLSWIRKDYDKMLRLTLTRNPWELKGPWRLTDAENDYIDVFCEDKEISAGVLALESLKDVIKKLDDLRYDVQADLSVKVLKGEPIRSF